DTGLEHPEVIIAAVKAAGRDTAGGAVADPIVGPEEVVAVVLDGTPDLHGVVGGAGIAGVIPREANVAGAARGVVHVDCGIELAIGAGVVVGANRRAPGAAIQRLAHEDVRIVAGGGGPVHIHDVAVAAEVVAGQVGLGVDCAVGLRRNRQEAADVGAPAR